MRVSSEPRNPAVHDEAPPPPRPARQPPSANLLRRGSGFGRRLAYLALGAACLGARWQSNGGVAAMPMAPQGPLPTVPPSPLRRRRAAPSTADQLPPTCPLPTLRPACPSPATAPAPATVTAATAATSSGDARLLVALERPEDVTALRLEMEGARDAAFVCLHGPDDVKARLTAIGGGEQGRPVLRPGPLQGLLEGGGTLFIDYTGFTQPEAESLNELFDHPPTFAGRRVHPNVQVVGALDAASLADASWSPAFLWRFDRILRRPPLPPAADPAGRFRRASPQQLPHATVIDLHDSRPWRRLLDAHVSLGPTGELTYVEAPLAARLQAGERIILRNPPLRSPHFGDFLRRLAAHPQAGNLSLFVGYTPEERRADVARHRLAAPADLPCDGAATVVTAMTFGELYETTVVLPDGRVATAPGLLESLGQRPLYVAGPLAEAQWDQLLRTPQPLHLVVAAASQPPADLQARVSAAAAPPPAQPVDLASWVPPQGASLLRTDHPDFAAQRLTAADPQALVLDVDPTTQLAELTYSLEKTAGRFFFAPRPLAAALAAGRTVILRGLQDNLDLQQGLASLLVAPRPYLIKDGQLAAVPGRLVVLQPSTGGSDLLDAIPARYVDAATAPQRCAHYAARLAQPGLDAATVQALLTFAEQVSDRLGQRMAGGQEFGLLSKLSASLSAAGAPQSLSAWGHGLARLLAEERAAAGRPTEEVARLAEQTFGPAPAGLPTERHAACAAILRHGRALFLQGPPGSGKSTGVYAIAAALGVEAERLVVLSVGPDTTRADLLGRNTMRGDSIRFEDGPGATWAKDLRPGKKILVVDEANLVQPTFWRFFAGAFDAYPAIWVNGERLPLTPDHKLIFTGNGNQLVGRFSHDVVRDHFVTKHFAKHSPAFLEEHVARPTLQHLAPTLPVDTRQRLIAQCMRLHAALEGLSRDLPLSPRNVQEAVLRAVHNLQVGEPQAIDLALWDAYAGMLDAAARRGLGLWWELELEEKVPSAAPPRRAAMPANLVLDKSTRELAGIVDRFLELRQWRIHNRVHEVGQVGLLIAGPSGRGKDAVVKQLLQQQGIAHRTVNAGLHYDNLLAALRDARESGSVVLLSELNLLNSGLLEGRLNALLSGPGATPGFAVIATMNPPSFAGRAPLSEALLNRFVVADIGHYAPEDVRQIAQSQLAHLRDLSDVDCLVEAHNDLAARLQNASSIYVPTARELLRAAGRLAADPHLAVDAVIDEVYAVHRSNLLTAACSTFPQATELTTLANLLRRPESPPHFVRLSQYAGTFGLRDAHQQTIWVEKGASPAMQQAQVVWQVLEAAAPPAARGEGEADIEALRRRLDGAKARYPSLAPSFATMQAALPSPHAQTPSLLYGLQQSSAVSRLQSYLLAPLAAVQLTLHSLRVLAPWETLTGGSKSAGGGRSRKGQELVDIDAVGSGLLAGAARKNAQIMGSWRSSHDEATIYLGTGWLNTFRADGTLRSTVQLATAAGRPPASGAVLGSVMLNCPQVLRHQGKEVVELLVPADQLPSEVRAKSTLGHSEADATPQPIPFWRLDDGRWLAEVDDEDDVKLSYDLHASADSPLPWQQASQKSLPFTIHYGLWPQLCSFLVQSDVNDAAGFLRGLQHFFNVHMTYSLAPETRAQYLSSTQTTLVNKVLSVRAGCCDESAQAFLAIARDYLGGRIPLRFAQGHLASEQGISSLHAWVEAFLPETGWTVFDPTGHRLDTATAQMLGSDDRLAIHMLPLDAEAVPALKPVRDAQRQVPLCKRSAVAAQVERPFVHSLATQLQSFLFSASLDVRRTFSQTPGQLDPERLVRGEVEAFASHGVGRSRVAKAFFLPADHPCLDVAAASYLHETLRALFALHIPVQIFDVDGNLTRVRSLREAQALYRRVPINKALAATQASIEAHHARVLGAHPHSVVLLDTDDPFFSGARRLWLQHVEHAAALPPLDAPYLPRIHMERHGSLEIGNSYQGAASEGDIAAALAAYPYATSLTFHAGFEDDFPADLRLPHLPNLRHLEIWSRKPCRLTLPHRGGGLRISGSSFNKVQVIVHSEDPANVAASDARSGPQVEVRDARQPSAAGRLPEAEEVVHEPWEFLQNDL